MSELNEISSGFPNASAYCSVRLYADGTSLTASGNDLDKLLSEINTI